MEKKKVEILTYGDIVAKRLRVVGVQQMVAQAAEVDPPTGGNGDDEREPAKGADFLDGNDHGWFAVSRYMISPLT